MAHKPIMWRKLYCKRGHMRTSKTILSNGSSCKTCMQEYSRIRAKHLHGISVNDYNRIFQIQGGKCAICGIHQSQLNKALYIDHNHENNTLRGLLCRFCNLGLGCFQDKLQSLRQAIHYIEKTSHQEVIPCR